jgi:hypothetical protein
MPPITIRYDRRRALRALAICWLLGTVAATVFGYGAAARGSFLGRALAGFGAQPGIAVFALIEALTLAGVLYAAGHVLRRRHRLRLTARGVEVEDSVGRYVVEWENLAETGTAAGPLAGLKVRDRDRLLATHEGSGAQRALLASREPVAGYDLVFTRDELECGIEPFLATVNGYWQAPDCRADLAEEPPPGAPPAPAR